MSRVFVALLLSAIALTSEAQRPRDTPAPKPATGDIELRMPKSAAISGRVVDESGEPLAMASVTAEIVGDGRGNSSRRIVATTLTDDLGDYRLGSLSAGSFVIGVRAIDGMVGMA